MYPDKSGSFLVDTVENDIKEYLSCKRLDQYLFICAFNQGSFFRLCVFKYKEESENYEEINFENYDYENTGYYNGYLYDTLYNYEKILCAKSEYAHELRCNIIQIIEGNGYAISFSEPIFYFSSDYYDDLISDRENCFFTEFNSEYLLCCACDIHVICSRYYFDLGFKDNFIIEIYGQKSYISFLKYSNHITIFFTNEDYLYKKDIYPPKCKTNLYKEVFTEEKMDIEELFNRDKDGQYYIFFSRFNTEIITLKLIDNDEEAEIIRNRNYNINKGKIISLEIKKK